MQRLARHDLLVTLQGAGSTAARYPFRSVARGETPSLGNQWCDHGVHLEDRARARLDELHRFVSDVSGCLRRRAGTGASSRFAPQAGVHGRGARAPDAPRVHPARRRAGGNRPSRGLLHHGRTLLRDRPRLRRPRLSGVGPPHLHHRVVHRHRVPWTQPKRSRGTSRPEHHPLSNWFPGRRLSTAGHYCSVHRRAGKHRRPGSDRRSRAIHRAGARSTGPAERFCAKSRFLRTIRRSGGAHGLGGS